MRSWWAVLAALALAACGAKQQPGEGAPQPDASAAAGTPAKAGAGVVVSVPQMAYSYQYRFRLPGDRIAGAEQAAQALCDRAGITRCQLLNLSDAQGDGDQGQASLKLRVATDLARRFGSELQRQVSGAGGRSLAATVAAEDVSKDMSDTEARIRQRELLVGRLTQILATRQGPVADLVQAERSVAAAQEELDQARAWLGELRGRVAYSTIEVAYEAIAPGTGAVGGSLGEALTGSWSTFVNGLAALVQIVIYLLPWALLVGAVVWAVRRLRGRPRYPAAPLPAWTPVDPPPAPPPTPA